MSTIKRLIFDIETVGDDFDSFDEATKKELTRWIKRQSQSDEAYEAALTDLKAGLGFSPLTGQIITIGVLDYYTGKGVVYFQAPDKKIAAATDGDISYKSMTEAQMLDNFWKGALKYQQFITFNGRQFDVPFLMIRSAVHNLRPTKDLLRNRYLSYQNADALHIDLYDQLNFYGAMGRRGTLHNFSRIFGIDSPKDKGMAGDEVAEYFKKGKYLEIAKYNARDLFATKALFDKWDQYLRF